MLRDFSEVVVRADSHRRRASDEKRANDSDEVCASEPSEVDIDSLDDVEP